MYVCMCVCVHVFVYYGYDRTSECVVAYGHSMVII